MADFKIFPYLLPSSERISVTEWRQQINDEEAPLQELLSHWDPGMSLHVLIMAAVDIDAIRTDCHLTSDDILRLAITWYSPGTGLRGHGGYIDLSSSSSFPLKLDLCIPGELLADRVRIEVCLVLARTGKSTFALAPRRPGSILWREEKTIILEGQASRFPTELIDFSESPYLPENASWYLEWDWEDFNQMALGSMRLLINSKNDRVKRAVTETNAADEVIRDIIRFDVGRTMIIGALNNDAFVQSSASYVDGSVGSFTRRLLRTLFPEEDLEGIVQLYQQNRSIFESELQARFKLFQEV